MATNIEAREDAKTYPFSSKAEKPKARGDIINGERYASKAFADREWEHMWKRVWHLGGRVSQLEDAGDFIVHNFRHESVVMVKQQDGSIRAFFNVYMQNLLQVVWDMQRVTKRISTLKCWIQQEWLLRSGFFMELS